VDGLDGGVDADLRLIGLAPARDGAQALVDHAWPSTVAVGGAVTGDVVGLGGDLLGELGTHVLEGSGSSTSRAIVTPSLVMVGPP
jgi:hypothetical protein